MPPPSTRKGKGGAAKSSAAAAFLTKNGSNAALGFGSSSSAFGFGTPSPSEPATTSHQDPEISQWLKHLSKKDENTKVKALNNLQSRIKNFSSEEAGEFLPSWLFTYKKLCTDNSRGVRAGGAKVLSQVVQTASRNAAPHLKELLGPLCISMQDMHQEAREQCGTLFKAMFSTAEKRRQALLRARKEIVSFVRVLVFSSAADLGEPTKESEEEMQDRAARLHAQALLALGATVKLFPTVPPSSNRATIIPASSSGEAEDGGREAVDPEAAQAAARQMNEPLKELWVDERFWKRPLEQHAHDASVWTAWCRLVSSLALHQPDHLAPAAHVLAPMVYKGFRNSPESCQDAAWTALLCFISACPEVLKDAALLKQLAADVTAQMKAGHVNASMLSALLPLCLQLLKHGPEDWGSAQLQAVWLPAMHAGFKKSAGGRGGVACAQALSELLLLLLKMHQSSAESAAKQADSGPVNALLKELLVHVHGKELASGLCRALSKLVQTEGRFDAAAQSMFQALQAQCNHIWTSDAACVGHLQPLLAELSRVAVDRATCSKLSKMIGAELLGPLTNTFMVAASQQQLSTAQAHVLTELAASMPSSDSSALSADLLGSVASSSTSRALACGPNLPADNADVAVAQGLLGCGLVPWSHVTAHLLSLLLSSADSKNTATDLLRAGHTVSSFAETYASIQQKCPADELTCTCELVVLLLQSSAARHLSADSASETLFLICFGSLLQSAHAACSHLLVCSAVPSLLHSAHFSDDRGLLYMITVTLQAATAACSTAPSIEAVSRIMPCAVLCLTAESACAGDVPALTPLQAFKSSALPLIFDLAVPVLASATQISSFSHGESHLRHEAAAFWRAHSTLPSTCSTSDFEAVMQLLMHKLLASWDAEQELLVHDLHAQGEGREQLLRKLCSSAACYAAEVVALVTLASAGKPACQLQLLQGLADAAFCAATRPDTATEATQSEAAQHKVLLVCAVLLRIDNAEVLAGALSKCVLRHAAEIAAVQLCGDTGPSCSFLAALLRHAAATLPADEASLQLSSLLQELWSGLLAGSSLDGAKLPLTALLTAISCLPRTAAAAVAQFFCAVESEAAEQICAGHQSLGVHACLVVTAAALKVQVCAVPSEQGGAVAEHRDSFACMVLAWLSKRPPLLSRGPGEAATGCSASLEASGMLAVASLFLPVPLLETPPTAANSLHVACVSLLRGGSEDEHDPEPEQQGEQQAAAAYSGGGLDAGIAHSEERHEGPQPDHAPLVPATVQKAFSDAAAHQLRSAKVPGVAAGCHLPAADQDALQHLFLAAQSNAGLLLSSSTTERLERYLDERVSAATLAVEQHCEGMCGALLNATQELASRADDIQPKECMDIVLQLSWSKPALVRSRLLGAVEASCKEAMPTTAGLHGSTCELLCQLCKSAGARGGAAGFSEVLDHVQTLVVRLLLCHGVALHIAGLLAEEGSAVVWDVWVPGSAHFWHTAAQAALLYVSDANIDKAAQEFDAWAESELGVPAVKAAVGILQCDAGSACMHAAATRIALHPSVLSGAVQQTMDGEEQDGREDEGGDSSARQTLLAAGFDASVAQALVAPQPLTVANCDAPLLLCCILLGSLEALPAEGRRRASLALSNCDPAPIPPVLDLIMLLLPSADTAEQQAAPSGAQAAEGGTLWQLHKHTVATLQASAVSGQWRAAGQGGCHLSVYDVSALSVGVYRALLRLLPASVRSWFSMLKSQRTASVLQEYTTSQDSPHLVQSELQAAQSTKSPGMSVTASSGQREVVASIEVDDGVMLDLAITLPACYPLQAAEVTLRRTVAIQEKLLRRWLLSMAGLLRSQNCSLADALVVWKSNVDQEFAGVEPCMICYSVINPSNRSLPQMCCKTCSQTFHNICLFKWFRSAGKSSCPHCQCPW